MKKVEIMADADRYAKASVFLNRLHDAYRQRRVSTQEAKTLRGQALAGDIDAAAKGLARLIAQRM